MKRLCICGLFLLFACSDGLVTQPEADPILPQSSLHTTPDLITTTGVPVTVLGLGGARDINQRSQVVGYSWNAKGEKIAVMWDHGTMIDLGTPAGANLEGRAINDLGQVAISAPRFFDGDAYFWEGGEATLIALDTRVYGINNRGQVVGWHHPGTPDAFVWEDGQFTVLPIPDGFERNRVFAVNDAGQVAGFSVGPGGWTRGFIWERKGSRALSTPDGYESRGYSINNRGDVAGFINLPGGLWETALWRDGLLIGRGTVGGNNLHPLDLNDLGQVVGWSRILPGDQTWPFLWPGPSGEIMDLGRPLGEQYAGLSTAAGINNRGQVVGFGGLVLRAYMWSPQR